MALDLYLDTADVSEWDSLMPTGMFKGITTNPLLAHRSGLTYSQINWGDMAKRAADLGAVELHGQVYGNPSTYPNWAETLMKVGQAAGIRTVIKVPLVEPAIRQVPKLIEMGCPILMTACYDAKQMFVATALGANYIAPYFGRMLEADLPAYDMLDQMIVIGQGSKTRVLVASLRSAEQMCLLAERGCDCFTISPNVARELLNDAKSQTAYEAFEHVSN
ncbi:MAG: transaldolase family protein [Planktomarina sp.]